MAILVYPYVHRWPVAQDCYRLIKLHFTNCAQHNSIIVFSMSQWSMKSVIYLGTCPSKTYVLLSQSSGSGEQTFPSTVVGIRPENTADIFNLPLTLYTLREHIQLCTGLPFIEEKVHSRNKYCFSACVSPWTCFVHSMYCIVCAACFMPPIPLMP